MNQRKIKLNCCASNFGGALTFSLQNDGVGYQADNLQLPSDVMTAVQDVSAKIKSGALTPPADIPDPTVP